MKGLHELFIHELHMMLDAEKQIVRALPNVIQAAASKKLKRALSDHLEETEQQVHRLETILRELHQGTYEASCEPMRSLLDEADCVIASDYEPTVKDAALINCAQHIEHYEIASYGVLKSLAKNFNYDYIFELLEESSTEEGNANKILNKIAQGSFLSRGVNTKAAKKAA